MSVTSDLLVLMQLPTYTLDYIKFENFMGKYYYW